MQAARALSTRGMRAFASRHGSLKSSRVTVLPATAHAVLVVLNGHRAAGLPEAVTQLLAGSAGLRLLANFAALAARTPA